MSLQRSEQNGRAGFSELYNAKRPHCGHLTCLEIEFILFIKDRS